MSVVTRSARIRWAIVASAVGALVCLPTVTTAVVDAVGGADAGARSPRGWIQHALASTRVPHTGLAESRGNLGLPDVPELESVAAQFGETIRTRVWWAEPDFWRVDVVTPTGEQGTYDAGQSTVLWDYEQSRLTEVLGEPPLRLPRPDDLVPPQAARRLLAAVGPGDAVMALPGSRVAGVAAVGVRIEPGDPRSTIGRLDVWLDPRSGLPVRLDVVDDAGVTALSSRFTDLDLARPDPAALSPPTAPGATHDWTTAPDLVSRIQQFRAVRLPDSLAGLPAGPYITGGTVTYGSGLTRFAVQPLTGRLAESALDALRTSGQDLELPGGETRAVTSGPVSLVILRSAGARRGYLIAGLVTPDVLTSAAASLLADPPPRTFQ
jgi:hypothetical protein